MIGKPHAVGLWDNGMIHIYYLHTNSIVRPVRFLFAMQANQLK